MTEGVRGGGGDSDEKWGGVRWAGSGATGSEVQISRGFRSDGQGVQVSWAGSGVRLGVA